jgi:hypothetical protein
VRRDISKISIERRGMKCRSEYAAKIDGLFLRRRESIVNEDVTIAAPWAIRVPRGRGVVVAKGSKGKGEIQGGVST